MRLRIPAQPFFGQQSVVPFIVRSDNSGWASMILLSSRVIASASRALSLSRGSARVLMVDHGD